MATRAAGGKTGFTLFEILVVVFVIGVLGSTAAVKAGKVMTQTKLQRAAQKIQTDVQQAFAIAGRNRRAVVLRWNSGALEMQVTDRAQTTIYRRSGLGPGAGLGLAAADVTVYPTALTVFPSGMAADTMHIRLSKSGFTKVLRVSRAGIVRIE
jgi:prepilin-type N-terminal cleavage/methylation domain-containing protein